MLVWHVETRLHAAHRQFFADRLITWIACAPSTGGDRVLLSGSLDRHLSMDALAASLVPPTARLAWFGLVLWASWERTVSAFLLSWLALADASVARTLLTFVRAGILY